MPGGTERWRRNVLDVYEVQDYSWDKVSASTAFIETFNWCEDTQFVECYPE